MLSWIALAAVLSVDPCYGFTLPDQVEGTHVWVEHDDRISTAVAQDVADAADAAWDDYVETMHWPAPPEPISILANFEVDNAFGRCITLECDDGHVPQCDVYGPAFDFGSQINTTAHEVGHAFQYGITGPFGVALSAWAWWMEGTAEYMAYRLHPVPGTHAVIGTYLGNPQWQLHHNFSEFIDGVRTGHMYGTAVLAMFVDEHYGGPDTVREIWEWGAMQGEDPILFRDAIEGVGIEFDTFWPEYLAHLSVVDLSVGSQLDEIPAHLEFDGLPGAATPPEVYFPEGLGMAFFRVPASLGQPDATLVVRVLGDDAVRWHGALARVDAVTPGGHVLDFVGAQSGADGVVTLELEGFDGQHDVMVGLSPEALDPNPFAFSIEAELAFDEVTDGTSTGEDPEPASTGTQDTDDGPTQDEAGSNGGCRVHRNANEAWLFVWALFFAHRRLRPRQ